MKWAPQIRLRTIFLLFFCAAVGLTTYVNPLSALGPATESAMVIGLLQQVRQLARSHPAEINADSALSFAERYAIAWRTFIAATIAILLIGQMLLARGWIQMPEREEFLIIEPLTQGLSSFCVLIVLCNSLTRWRSASIDKLHPKIRAPFLWALALIALLIMLVDATMIDFLVHRAVAGIEAAIPKQFQRAGAYIQLADSGYRTLWLGLASIISLGVAAALIARASRVAHSTRTWSRATTLAALLLILPAATYSLWFYMSGFRGVSPDLASTGLALNWIDWIAGAIIAAMLVTAGAYRVATNDAEKATITTNLAEDIEQHSLHESFPCLLCLGINAGYELVLWAIELIDTSSFLGTPTIGRFLTFLCYPITLLIIARIIAALQLCWIRWRDRSRVISWEIVGISQQTFFITWILLALILVVGIPTLRAFAFLLWLGPYNLLPVFGF